jgi:hypothetical protein
MKSPFPGMDPYLESRWGDVHNKLVTYVAEAIQADLPPELRARSEERVLLESTHERLAEFVADVGVTSTGGAGRRGHTRSPATTLEPVLVDFVEEPLVHRFVKIIDVASGNRVITIIEILSPWNKRFGRLNRSYKRKLDHYADSGVSLVEVDLLRGSRKHLHVDETRLAPEKRADYYVCVRRSTSLDRYEVYPIHLRERLPRVPIPLRPREDDLGLELQPLIDHVYVAGGHDDIDYSIPPRPPLDDADAAWADELLRAAGKR